MATVSSIRKKALKWMTDLAADQSHGYSQQSRWGPDYDCSSSVISAWQTAGVPVKTAGATYTGNMKKIFLANGFSDVTKKVDLASGSGLVAADVLLNEDGRGTSGNGHTSMYAGDGLLVHARGQSYGSSKSGDQGTEIAVTAYRNHPYYTVLRYTGGQAAETSAGTMENDPAAYIAGTCTVSLNQFLIGAENAQIKTIQRILRQLGYKGKDKKVLTIDGELGENTAYAITQFQKAKGLKNINYGTVAAATWKLLLNAED